MNKKKVKYSIIVPCYNVAQYLPKFVENIPTDNIDFELIFINDGSTDNTLNILKKIITKNKNFVLINMRNNMGVAQALNKGVYVMKTNWYARLDPDDIVYKEYFKEISKYINDENALIRYKFQIYDNGRIKNPHFLRKLYFKHAWGWSLLININVIKKPNWNKSIFYEDLYAFGANYKKHKKKEIFINKYLAAYRANRDGSVTDMNYITKRKIEDLERAYTVYKKNKNIKWSVVKFLLIIKIWYDIKLMKRRYMLKQKNVRKK